MTQLQEERNQLLLDVYRGKRPKRIPMTIVMNIEAAMEYLGFSITKDLCNPAKCYEAADKIAQLIETDTVPVSPASTPAAVFRYTGAKFMVPGDDGFFQHPNFSPMEYEEYPELIEDPFKFMVNKIHPRVFEVFDTEPELAHLRIKTARQVVNAQFAGMMPKLQDTYERTNCTTTAGMGWAPFDFIADYVRNFSNILLDMKRNPQWILDACDSVLDYELEQIKHFPKPTDPNKLYEVFVPLHMAPYMRHKEVEKFYWPTYKKLIEAYGSAGYIANVYYEANWTPHMELLDDLKVQHVAKFENVSYEDIAKYTPKNFTLMCSYPMGLVRNGSKQECIDEAKKILDILGGTGRYIFSPNKRYIRGKDFNMENIQALYAYVRENGVY